MCQLALHCVRQLESAFFVLRLEHMHHVQLFAYLLAS